MLDTILALKLAVSAAALAAAASAATAAAASSAAVLAVEAAAAARGMGNGLDMVRMRLPDASLIRGAWHAAARPSRKRPLTDVTQYILRCVPSMH